MTINDSIAADHAAVDAAQTALDAATAQLAADQAKLDAAQPHLSAWAEVEASAIKFGGDIESELMAIVTRGRALLGV